MARLCEQFDINVFDVRTKTLQRLTSTFNASVDSIGRGASVYKCPSRISCGTAPQRTSAAASLTTVSRDLDSLMEVDASQRLIDTFPRGLRPAVVHLIIDAVEAGEEEAGDVLPDLTTRRTAYFRLNPSKSPSSEATKPQSERVMLIGRPAEALLTLSKGPYLTIASAVFTDVPIVEQLACIPLHAHSTNMAQVEAGARVIGALRVASLDLLNRYPTLVNELQCDFPFPRSYEEEDTAESPSHKYTAALDGKRVFRAALVVSRRQTPQYLVSRTSTDMESVTYRGGPTGGHIITNLTWYTDESVNQWPNKRKKTAHTAKATLPTPARQNPWVLPAEAASTTQQTRSMDSADKYDEYFEFDHFTPEAEQEIARIEREALGEHSQIASTSASTLPPPSNTLLSAEQLKDASKKSGAHVFFSKRETFAYEADSDDEDMDSENEDDESEPRGARNKEKVVDGGKAEGHARVAIYILPRNHNLQPLVFQKQGTKLLRPRSFGKSTSPGSFWIHPPEPVLALEGQQFNPPSLYQPRVFLWLPHFFVSCLKCPKCHAALEKNGALRPRRIVDVDSCFYIVTWAYYCRDGCKSYFHGWSETFLRSLPEYLRLAFPAILSRKSGLSRNLLMMSRVGNQHKMGPSGLRAMLFEMHTHRYNGLMLQYLESAFERNPSYIGTATVIPAFGDFADPQRYAGFVPSISYLTAMLNKAIERDEADADQHTSCLAPDQTDLDDSFKIVKHIANEDGVPLFAALWTCMTSRFIRAQALTLTKSQEERIGPLMGIATSAKRYGLGEPLIAYSDDPVKDKGMLCAAFPSLGQNLTPMATAHGLKPSVLPPNVKVIQLESFQLIQDAFSSLVGPLDSDPSLHICVHRYQKLPASLVRFFISPRVFFVGSSIRGDFTRLKKQFTQLENQTINIIDLKHFAIQRALIGKKDSGSLDTLAEKFLGLFLSKDPSLRMSEDWERSVIAPDLINYAALDVFTSRLIFEKLSETAALERVEYNTPPGTRVALLAREGGEITAYGKISPVQTSSYAGVRITKSRVLVDIDSVIIPSAAAVLHVAASNTSAQSTTKAGALTLSHLRSLSDSPSSSFALVSPVSLLQFDQRELSEPTQHAPGTSSPPLPLDPALFHHTEPTDLDSNEAGQDEEFDDKLSDTEEQADERLRTQLLEAQAEAGIDNHFEDGFDASPLGKGLWNMLNKIMTSPEDAEQCYTRIKKDIFHAFHMIPLPSSHGLRAVSLRDHMMRWDPAIRARVDEKCRKVFKIDFDVMLLRNPRWIKKRTPRYVPPPSVLVPAIEHVFNIFGGALDAKSGEPLFNAVARQKANAVLDLAREGYLSDPAGVVLYEKIGVDKYGLELFSCRRGTNKLEGGPHSDIYRKFGAFHAAPRLTVNSLTDHRTHYNLQAMAKHEFGVNWEYHHDLALINRTSFLLNYLADIVPGVDSYADWLNADLYQRTTEKFGICEVPESFRTRLGMAPYDENAVERFKLNGNNDWLRRRQGVALPIVPPTTPEARKYYFANVGDFVVEASVSGKRKISHENFANRWNSTADGKTRFYVSADLLASFAKSWEKTNNARASQELISAKVDLARQTRQLFQETSNLPFPSSLLGTATASHPQEGVIEFEPENPSLPDSISTELAISRPQIPSPTTHAPPRETMGTSCREKSSSISVPAASRVLIPPSVSTSHDNTQLGSSQSVPLYDSSSLEADESTECNLSRPGWHLPRVQVKKLRNPTRS
ncbi:hypothetical protein R3P38DRAFT_3215931 [Favolaschia claudopus]|uniref:3'-5' exonuclease n=1 Tax=Favolaschia claudopus TaxID=2862362 RepID=A0AAW0A7J1_9AGAR